MKSASRRETAWGIAVVLAVIFAIAAHVAIVEGFHQPLFGAWLSLVPLAGLLASAVHRWRRPRAMLVAAITAVAAVWLGWPLIEHHFASMFFAEHAGANLVLAIVFGHTLLGNREALSRDLPACCMERFRLKSSATRARSRPPGRSFSP